MFQQIINLLAGDTVRSLMQFYRQYSQIINALVVIYGFSLLWVHNNLRVAIKNMEQLMLHISSEIKDTSDHGRVHKQFVKKWNELMGNRRFVVPSKSDLWYERVMGDELINVLHIKPEYVYLVLKQDKTADSNDLKKKYRAWQEYRHNLRVGLRRKKPI